MYLGLLWVQVVEDLLLEAPKKVTVGEEVQLVLRVIIKGGKQVTLIGSGCGVTYQSVDDSIQIDDEGRAVAVAKGMSGIVAFYEGKGTSAKIQVSE